MVARVPDLVGDYHFVPVWNPADLDKGISSHHLAATPSVATTQSSALASTGSSSFWHSLGTVYKAGAAVAGYYMGNDPCRTTNRRRMVQTVETGAARAEPPLQTQADCVAELSQVEQPLEPVLQHQGPAYKEYEWPGELGDFAGEGSQGKDTAECELHRVPLDSGNTEVGASGPKATTTETTKKHVPDCPETKQSYTLYLVALMILVALFAIAIS